MTSDVIEGSKYMATYETEFSARIMFTQFMGDKVMDVGCGICTLVTVIKHRDATRRGHFFERCYLEKNRERALLFYI